MKGKLSMLAIVLLASCLNDEIISPQKQLLADIAAIDSYIDGLTLQPGEKLIEDASGIRLIISEVGTAGLPPNEWNEITIGYVGKVLSSGFQFDQNQNFATKLSNNLILGWKYGIPLLPEGSVAKLFIPSVYAYGANGGGSIPGNANLVFDINLKSVVLSSQQTERTNSDKATINTYLTTNNIPNTIEHESGIRYKITQEGTGNFPTWYDKVKLSYSARLLNSQTPFLSETVEPTQGFSSRIVNYRLGLQVAMKLLKPGGKGTFYVPSDLAYGAYSYSDVPANSIVVYEVELISVTQ